jgi:hypothetical protein
MGRDHRVATNFGIDPHEAISMGMKVDRIHYLVTAWILIVALKLRCVHLGALAAHFNATRAGRASGHSKYLRTGSGTAFPPATKAGTNKSSSCSVTVAMDGDA